MVVIMDEGHSYLDCIDECVCVCVCVCVRVCDASQNMDYRLRFTVLEWSRIEWELTRERGLWGPDHPSPLDKWMLDTVEG